MTRPTVRSRKLYRSYVEAFILAIIVGIVIRSFVITPYKIPSSAMIPTLMPGDYVFVYKLPYGIKFPFFQKIGKIQKIHRGDVILFSYPRSPSTRFIKRVIAVEGDTVLLKNRKVYVNDHLIEKTPLEENVLSDFKSKSSLEFYTEHAGSKKFSVSYGKGVESEEFGPLTVPMGEVFVVGDNRDGSDDSRYWGTVPLTSLEGRVVFIWFSFDMEQVKMRWDRFFEVVQ